MTVLCKNGKKFLNVIDGSISVYLYCDDGGSWKGDMSEVYYCLDLISRKSASRKSGACDSVTFPKVVLSSDLKKVYSVLKSMLEALNSGAEVWEVPIE